MNIQSKQYSCLLGKDQRTWIQVENRLLRVGNILYCPCRGTSAKILKIKSKGYIYIQFYAQGYLIYSFDIDSLQLESSNPYQVNG